MIGAHINIINCTRLVWSHVYLWGVQLIVEVGGAINCGGGGCNCTINASYIYMHDTNQE